MDLLRAKAFTPTKVKSRKIVPGDKPFSVQVVFPNNKDIRESLKSNVPGYWYDGTTRKWYVDLSMPAVRALPRFAIENGFTVGNDVVSLFDEYNAKAQQFERMSKALDGKPIGVAEMYPELWGYQRGGIKALMEMQRAFLADDVGLGKTVQALIAVENLKAFPCLIVCPATLRTHWQDSIFRWAGRDDFKVQILTSKDRIDREATHLITSWNMLGRGLGKEPSPLIDRIVRRRPVALIADEFHRAKNHKSQQSQALKQITEMWDIPYRFGLSATPMPNRPSEFIQQLQILGLLTRMGGFRYFANAYCGEYRPGNEKMDAIVEMSRSKNVATMHKELRRAGFIRRKKESVMPQLPPKRKIPVVVSIKNMSAYLKQQKKVLEKLEDLNPDQAGKMGVVEMNALKRITAKHKMDSVKEWIRDFLDQTEQEGGKLLVFAHHLDIIGEMADAFKDVSVRYTGKESNKVRDKAVGKFQNDDKVRLFFGSIMAAGEGITLTAAKHILFVEMGWTPKDHEQAEGRAYGRISDAHSVDSFYMIAKGTIDERLMTVLERKERIFRLAMDGKRITKEEQRQLTQASIITDVIKEIRHASS